MSVVTERKGDGVNASMVSIHFNSITDLMDYKFPPDHRAGNVYEFNKYLYESHAAGGHREGGRWYGPGLYHSKDVVNKALLGDHELYNNHLKSKCDELNKQLGTHTKTYRQPIRKVKRRKVKRDFGDEVDIHKIYQGKLDTAWSTTERVEVDSKHHLVTLCIDIGGNMNVSAVDSLWRTAVAIKLIDELQSAGKAVQVIVVGLADDTYPNSEVSKYTTSVSIVVKRYNENLSLERLAAMTSLGFYRVFGFAAKFVNNRSVNWSLGFSVKPTPKNLPLPIRDEVEQGHTKVVIVKRANSLREAIESIKDAYAQMDSFAKSD